MLIGALVGVGMQIVTTAVFIAMLPLIGHDFRLADTGDDVFDRAGEVLEWGDKRLKAASEGAPLPDVPKLYADVTSIKVGFATTLVFEASLVAIVAVAIGQRSLRGVLKTFRMDSYSWDELWVPGVAVIAMYLFVIGYGLAVDVLDIEILKPRSTVPASVTRDAVALAVAGVLACLVAPIAEELFFRGLVFRGLLKWGFWPAAIVTSAFFCLAHLNIGSLIPFFIVGMVMAYLYWRRGCLWDSIAFHFLFNGTSYILLVAKG